MNRFVASPGWHGYIIAYFFLGGIAAGAYALASLASLFGSPEDRRAARVGYYLTFPLVCVCGILLIIDLGRPERFWHMLIQSQTGWPMLKWWSPMSVGSWGLSAFGAFSFASFLGALAEDGFRPFRRLAPLAERLHRGWFGTAFETGGTLSAFFLGAYTGTLLSATNQPIWADTTWISPLFLASSATTGLAAILLLVRWRLPTTPHAVLDRWERLDLWAAFLELAMLAALAISLAASGLAGAAFARWPGWLIPAFVVPVGLLLPIFLKRLGTKGAVVSAALVLLGGLALRAALVGMPEPLLLAHH